MLLQAPLGVVGVRGGSASPWAEPVLETGAALLAGNGVILASPISEPIRAAFERGGVPLELIAAVAPGEDLGALAPASSTRARPRQKGAMLVLDGRAAGAHRVRRAVGRVRRRRAATAPRSAASSSCRPWPSR